MIPLHEPNVSKAEIDYVKHALESNWVSTGGPFVDKFEESFAKFVGRKFAVSTSNGTVALQLAIEVLKRRQKNTEASFDVLVPTLSFIATANSVVHAGCRPVFVDCSKDSMGMGASQLQNLLDQSYLQQSDGQWIAKDTGATLLGVMPAHIMGWGGQIKEISAICGDSSLVLVEDAAESFGSRHLSNARHLGSDGLAAVFSFNGNKILTTGGGGMLVCDDLEFARRAKHLSTTAKTDPYRYEHDEVGFNFRLVNVLAAMGLAQLERFEQTRKRKIDIALAYESLFSIAKGVKLYKEQGYDANQWLNNVVYDSRELMESSFERMRQAQIGARPLWKPFHLQKAFSHIKQPVKSWPNSEWFWERTLSLPSSPTITEDSIKKIAHVALNSSKGNY
jgi:perosamine synthetase